MSLPGITPGRLAAAGAVVVVLLIAALSGRGTVIFTQTQAFLDFGAGVLALVSLTSAVVWEVIATDRLFLQPIHRILAQGVHRAAAGLGFLGLHIWIKVTHAHTIGAAAVVPFADPGRPGTGRPVPRLSCGAEETRQGP